jgi:hypothetical protein
MVMQVRNKQSEKPKEKNQSGKLQKEEKMSYPMKLMMISVMMIFATITVGGVYASTVTVSGGQISQVGGEISVPIVLDTADNGLIYYQMRITVADPTVAQVTRVDFPSWATISNVTTTLPATVVEAWAGDLATIPSNLPGTPNVLIATVTLKGLKAGPTQINLAFGGQCIGGATVRPAIQAGTLQVGSSAPTTGEISVSSVPTGAKIYLDGTDTGLITPNTKTGVSPGSHTVRCNLTGYTDNSQSVTVTAGVTIPVSLTLTPVSQPSPTTGEISVSSVPTGAKIYLDGTDTGLITPNTKTGVSPGSHTIRCSLADYTDNSQTVTVTAGVTIPVTLTLTPVSQPPTTGAISVSSVPTGAKIYLDGTDTGLITPNTKTGVSPGSHTIRCSLADYTDNSQTVTVTAGVTIPVSLTLTPVSQPSPTTGEISVSSVPTSATVFLDGVNTGHVTSTTLTGITPGLHTLLIKLSGYVDASQPVTVTVGQTTQATLTLIPTMPVPTGPTGQVYFSTTPQGATIFIDGAPANSVTPTIMAVSVGTHQAVFKLAGYNDLQAGFVAQMSSMTSVSRRLSPGSGVIIPITPGTTGTPVFTVVPTTTVTHITTVPTTAPGSSWYSKPWLPSWVRNLLPFYWR